MDSSKRRGAQSGRRAPTSAAGFCTSSMTAQCRTALTVATTPATWWAPKYRTSRARLTWKTGAAFAVGYYAQTDSPPTRAPSCWLTHYRLFDYRTVEPRRRASLARLGVGGVCSSAAPARV